MSVLGSFLSEWGGMPSGIVGAVFPALAGILLREDDVDVLIVPNPSTVLFFCGFSLFLAIVRCWLGSCTEWTTITQFIDFPRISRNLPMVFFP